MTMLYISSLLGHPVLPRKYLHNCLKKVLEQSIQ